jgi:hypothetical protein
MYMQAQTTDTEARILALTEELDSLAVTVATRAADVATYETQHCKPRAVRLPSPIKRGLAVSRAELVRKPHMYMLVQRSLSVAVRLPCSVAPCTLRGGTLQVHLAISHLRKAYGA